MIVKLTIYPGWFTDDLSKKVCEKLNLPTVKSTEWVRLEKVLLTLEHNDLLKLLQKNKLTAIIFNPPDEQFNDIFLHPETLLKIATKKLKRKIRDNL